jgi:hypothetical protein
MWQTVTDAACFEVHGLWCEWYDELIQKFRIEVRVTNRFWGPLFGYRGTFNVEWKPAMPEDIPVDVKPRREERRE